MVVEMELRMMPRKKVESFIPHASQAGWLLVTFIGLTRLATAAQFGLFTYTDAGSSITITACSFSASGELTIPATIAGKPVTRIDTSAFEDLDAVTKVTIPEGVNSIGYSAFSHCDKLAAVVFPSTVTQIGSWAFRHCKALASITLPANLASTGIDVFSGCNSLKSVTIPANLTSIGNGNFSNCGNLTSFSVAAGNTRYFATQGVLFERDSGGKVTLVQFPTGRSGSYSVPSGVVALRDSCFFGSRNLTSVTLPASVTSLTYYTFAYCDSLTSVNLPAGITDTGPGLFAYCPKLKQITLPANLERIGVNAFAGCEMLQGLAIPAKVTSIGDYAFEGCDALAGFSVSPASATYAALDGVVYDKSLATLMHFPGGRSGDFVVPSGVQRIGVGAFASNPGLERISLPDGLIEIGRGAFLGATALNHVRFPASLTTLGNTAFTSCTALTDVYFDGAAPTIQDYQVFSHQGAPTTVHFFNGMAGFTAPNWLGYPSVNMGPAVVVSPDIGVSAETVELVNGGDILEFTPAIVGQASSREIILRNGGNADLWGVSLRLGGGNSGDFEVDAPGRDTLAPGESMTLQIRFKPRSSGTHDSTLWLTSNDRADSPFAIGLTGTAIAAIPEIEVSPQAGDGLQDGKALLDFGSAALGRTGADRKLVIRNTGNVPLTGLTITRSGAHAEDFSVTQAPTSSLAPGASSSFKIRFKPSAKGNRSAVIHIRSNDQDENPFDIRVKGVGAPVTPEITVRKPSGANLLDGMAKIRFDRVTVGKAGAAQSFTIRNSGNGKLSGLAITKAGAHASDFIVTQPSKPSLAPGAELNFKVRFKPSAKGTRTAVIRIRSNDADENPFDIRLTGAGTR